MVGAILSILSSYDRQALREFYGKAPACTHIEKGGSWRFVQLLCKETHKVCGPRTCPFEDFGVLLSDKSEVEGLLEPQRSEPVEPVEVFPEMGTGGGAQATDREINVIHRKNPKVHSRPHVTAGSTIRRALVTFVSKNGEVRRWPFDCVYGPRRKPRILEFQAKIRRKNMTDARFYFPMQATDRDVKDLIGNWFVNLQVHDESASLNIMGSPTAFFVDLLDEA